MVIFIFTKDAQKSFLKLSKESQTRIYKKLELLKTHPDIFSILRRLSHFEPATHRLRIGTYRLILKQEEEKEGSTVFRVLDVGHRRDIYE